MRYKSRYFKKNLITSIFIYIIPIIVLLFAIICGLTSFLETEIEESVNSQLEKSVNTLSDNFSLLNTIANDMQKNETMFLNPQINESYSQLMIIKSIGRYLFINDFYEDIIFYYRGGDIAFTSKDCDSYEKFFSRSYKFDKASDEKIRAWLDETEIPTLIPAQKIKRFSGSSDVILYVVPLLSRKPEATAVFVIDNKWFSEQLENVYKKYNGAAFFYDSSGELVTSFCADNCQELARYNKDSVNLKGFTRIKRVNEKNGLELTALINKKVMFRPLYSVYALTALFIAGLLIFGMFLIMYLTRRAYMPIMNLKRMFENERGDGNDDIEIIRTGIENMRHINTDLSNTLVESEQRLKMLVLKDIIKYEKGGAYDDNLFENQTEDGKMILQRIIFINDKSGSCRCELYNRALAQSAAIRFFQLESEYADTSIYLIRYIEDEEENIEALFGEILDCIRKGSTDAVIIVGKSVDDIYKIRMSYLSADNAYYTRTGDSVMFASDEKYMNKYPSKQLEQFEKALKDAKSEEALNQLECIRNYTMSSSLSMFIKRCIVFELYNSFIKLIDDSEVNDAATDIIKKMIDDKENFEVRDFDRIFSEFAGYIQLFLEGCRRGNSKLVLNCCEYIHKHFFEYELSVQSLAEKLNVNVTLLNQQMKRELNMNVYEYITFVKMENAKYMLVNTELPIKSIVEDIGYCDVSSFGRKFKSVTGVSLSEYRKRGKRQ